MRRTEGVVQDFSLADALFNLQQLHGQPWAQLNEANGAAARLDVSVAAQVLWERHVRLFIIGLTVGCCACSCGTEHILADVCDVAQIRDLRLNNALDAVCGAQRCQTTANLTTLQMV